MTIPFNQTLALIASVLAIISSSSDAAPPILHDDRLELGLFAEHPQIVTPIGLAIDKRDRIFVLESHTHTPPGNYPGPKGDIVKMFIDAGRDGSPDGPPQHFAEGINAGMNLGFARDGTLYVCAAWEVIALPDKDNDGRADEKNTILRLETRNTYPHSAQMGIAFSRDDWIYISRGNNGSHGWTARGSDGSSISGFGDGGNVYRCRLDGADIQEVATGFWNSMNLKFDSHGRLLLVDNDPDARGPNRLVHVVEQGDYGHKSVFGGPGNHPFQGWDGTLPGTLGYVDGAGEAPCDLIDSGRTSFPESYRNQLLLTVWNENSIAVYEPKQNGTSITATHTVWMQGDSEFRPVALEADSKGNLFITDWVKVDYPNHGHGRIWRVSARDKNGLKPMKYFDVAEEQPGAVEFASLITATNEHDFKRLERALVDDDPYRRHAAVVALSRPMLLVDLSKTMHRREPLARLGALLAMRRGQILNPELHLKHFLRDPDEDVRRAALMWVGEEGLVQSREDTDQAIEFDDLSATVFEAYLATLETLSPEFIEGFRSQEGKASQIPRRLDPKIVEDILRDEQRPDRVRALALIHLENLESEETQALLKELAVSSTPVLQKEAIRSLIDVSKDPTWLFLSIAKDSNQPEDIRAEAVLGLSRSLIDDATVLLPLLDDESKAVQLEAIRALRVHAYDDRIRPVLEKHHSALKGDANLQDLLEQYEFALQIDESERTVERPESLADWQVSLHEGGDATAGERIFFANQTQCSNCHLIDNRGRRIGPELSNIGQSVSRDQIVASIIQPSAQFAPEYQAWFVELKDGDYFQGLQLDHKADGGMNLYTTEAITRKFSGRDISSYGVLRNSLMPDGLEQTMTVGEMRDLVAFLESLN